MTLYLFKLLAPEVQVRYTVEYGTYLAQRWEDEGGVNLYHCQDEGRGFFVEMRIAADKPLVVRSFISSVPLEDYSYYVRLPAF